MKKYSNIEITGSLNIVGPLRVDGTIVARVFENQLVSSSIIYESGSTKFGDSLDDTHEFTGSVIIRDSLVVDGVAITGTRDYAYAERTTDLNVPNNTTNVSYTTVAGNISQSSGAFTLQAGKVYQLQANVTSGGGAARTVWSWFNITTSTAIGGAQILTAPNDQAAIQYGYGISSVIIAPTVTTTVALRQRTNFNLNLTPADFGAIYNVRAWASIVQIG